jgi:hypothetical protein
MAIEDIKSFLSIWAIVGYFLMPLIRRPKTKIEGFIQWFIGGPFFWVGVLCFGIPKLFKR